MPQQRLPYEGSQSSAGLVTQLDVTCILRTWRIKGVMACPKPCIWVENAYPCGILEVVRQPFKSHMAEWFRIDVPNMTAGHNETNLQFAETRVFTYVPQLVMNLAIPLAVPKDAFLMLDYLSEIDPLGWRVGLLDFVLGVPPEKAGAWGDYMPRTGFITQQSEVLAAHLQALRAGRAASNPAGRIVVNPYPYQPRTGHCLQMVSPVRRACVTIGNPDLRSLESNALSLHGAYLFVHFGIFEECRKCLPVRLVPPRAP